jgi:hypothetical protein
LAIARPNPSFAWREGFDLGFTASVEKRNNSSFRDWNAATIVLLHLETLFAIPE